MTKLPIVQESRAKTDSRFSLRKVLLSFISFGSIIILYCVFIGQRDIFPGQVPEFKSSQRTLLTKINITVSNENSVPVTSDKTTKLSPSSQVIKSKSSIAPAPKNTHRHQISIQEAFDRFRYKASPQCDNTCTLSKTLCRAKDKAAWASHTRSKERFKNVQLFTDDEYIFLWERDYLRFPPFTDAKTLPDRSKAKIYHIMKNGVLSSSNVTLINAKIGEKIKFRVDLFDGYGRPRTQGLDEIRTWITTHDKAKKFKMYTSTSDHSAAGMVTDLNNGSYLLTITPVWAGKIQLNVALIYPREYIRAAIHNYRSGVHRFLYGLFQNKSTSEVTLCSPSPNIPGRPCLCNFTELNLVPIFCGRPLDTRLSCSDVVGLTPAGGVAYKNMTAAELKLEPQLARRSDQAMINHDFIIDVSKTSILKEPPPCYTKNFSFTWSTDAPKGLWSKGMQWTNLACKETHDVTRAFTEKCLANHRAYMIGDSNVVRLYKAMNLIIPTKHRDPWSWPYTDIFDNVENNITIMFRRHEHPYVYHSRWAPFWQHSGVALEVDKIPSKENYILIVHYYLHTSLYHLSTYYLRLVKLKEAIKRLLKRNSRGIIAIRGPHTSTVEWKTNHMFSAGVHGPFFSRILHDVFWDLREHVVLLDGWEMTVPITNTAIHPHHSVAESLLRTLIAIRCK